MPRSGRYLQEQRARIHHSAFKAPPAENPWRPTPAAAPGALTKLATRSPTKPSCTYPNHHTLGTYPVSSFPPSTSPHPLQLCSSHLPPPSSFFGGELSATAAAERRCGIHSSGGRVVHVCLACFLTVSVILICWDYAHAYIQISVKKLD